MRYAMWFFSLSVLCGALSGADALDAVEQDIVSKWEKITSATYTTDMTNVMENPQMSFHSRSTGTTEMLRQGNNWFMRMESTGETVQKIAGTETKSKQSTLAIADGEYYYSLSDNDGQKVATKMKIKDDHRRQADGKSFFKWMREFYNLKLLPDEAVAGHTCYVVEATAKDPQQAAMMPAMKYYFSKSLGWIIQTSTKAADGKTNMVMTLRDIKTDVNISADRFKFTPPPGVTVMDADAQEANIQKQIEEAQRQAAEAQKKAEDAQKETAAKQEPKEEKKEEKKETAAKKEEPKEEKKKEKKVKIRGIGF